MNSPEFNQLIGALKDTIERFDTHLVENIPGSDEGSLNPKGVDAFAIDVKNKNVVYACTEN